MHWYMVCWYLTALAVAEPSPADDPCYEDRLRARRCVPDFVNAAFGKPVEATSVCGAIGPARYCDATEAGGGCHVCRRPAAASYLTDLNNPNNVSCWRSAPTPPPGALSPPDNVTLILALGKKYELTYV